MSAQWYCPRWAVIRVFGPDAASWLNGIVTCAVSSASSEKATWGALLTKQGKIQSTFFAVQRGNDVYLVVTGGSASETLATLDGYLVMEDAEIEMSDLRVVLRLSTRVDSSFDLGPQIFQDVDSVACEPLGESTRLYLLTAPKCEEMKGLLSGDQWISESQFDHHRIRLGVPWFGADFSEVDNLHAAGLERRVVDWSKGCYLGQEVVCMQEMRGKVRKRVVALRVTLGEGTDVPDLPFELLDENSQLVGSCSSLAGEYALGRVASPHDQAGTRLFAKGSGGQVLLSVEVGS